MKSLSIKAGPAARKRIEREGLSPDMISHLGAAAGGPKWLILNRLDRALFGEWFKDRRQPMIAVGASIGSWRLACAAQRDPNAAIDRFEQAYIEQRYGPKPSAQDVSDEALRILKLLLGDSGIDDILNHPWLHLNIITARCRGWTGSQNALLQKTGLLGALLANLAHRRALGSCFERNILHNPASPALALNADGFRTSATPLTRDNLLAALMASASIPMVMSPVREIAGAAQGVYLDGGMIDYHMDLPVADPQGILFLPHFSEKVTTGWLDKFLPWRKPRNLDNALVVAPSREFLDTLPNKKVPDRHDFWLYANRDEDRMRDWKRVVSESQRMADEWMEVVGSGQLPARLNSA